MYSHGSSARVGVGGGKRGHGGRNYRPPPKRRDPNTTPPPLKQCSTLLQFQIPEYQSPEPQGRTHQSFGGVAGRNDGGGDGQKRIQKLEKEIRSQCLCHLVVPGKKQCGPVAIVGRTIQEALPAAAFLLNHLQIPTNNISSSTVATTASSSRQNNDDGDGDDYYYIEGQIQRNVKNLQDVPIVGRWCIRIRRRRHDDDDDGDEQQKQQQNGDVIDNSIGEDFNSNFTNNDGVHGPNWLFQSTTWNVMVCSIRIDGQEEENSNNSDSTSSTNITGPSSQSTTLSSTSEDKNTPAKDDNNNHEIAWSPLPLPLPLPLPPLLSTLKRCVDNVLFRMGNKNLQNLRMFIHEYPPMALALGSPDQSIVLFQEIQQMVLATSTQKKNQAIDSTDHT